MPFVCYAVVVERLRECAANSLTLRPCAAVYGRIVACAFWACAVVSANLPCDPMPVPGTRPHATRPQTVWLTHVCRFTAVPMAFPSRRSAAIAIGSAK